ncbi:MAG: hypothetical protein LLG37_01385 [Spirochaetia bacterium]|nr:hypothetical protein [Spirochaetia bacterium]
MKKAIAVVMVVVFSFALVSCSTVRITSGQGKYAFLVPETMAAKEVRTKQVWYILYGLIPLGDNSTVDMIKAKEKVSVKESLTIIDCLISALLGIVTIQSRTIEVTVH